jgi:hypothetical protein
VVLGLGTVDGASVNEQEALSCLTAGSQVRYLGSQAVPAGTVLGKPDGLMLDT